VPQKIVGFFVVFWEKNTFENVSDFNSKRASIRCFCRALKHLKMGISYPKWLSKSPLVLTVPVIPNACPTLPYSFLAAALFGKKWPENTLWRGILRGRAGGKTDLGNEPAVLGNLVDDEARRLYF
jgi:hypothetical protein